MSSILSYLFNAAAAVLGAVFLIAAPVAASGRDFDAILVGCAIAAAALCMALIFRLIGVFLSYQEIK